MRPYARAVVHAAGVRSRLPPAGQGGRLRRRGRYAAAALLAALAFAPAAAPGLVAMDGDDGPKPPGGAPGTADILRDLDRLRVELRPGGKLAFSGLPAAPAAGVVWESDDLRLGDAAPPPLATELDLAPLASAPDWLRLSGTLERSGAALELGAVGLDPPAWHGLAGEVWRLGVDARLASAVAFDEPLSAESLGAECVLALPLTVGYGPLSLETGAVGATWRRGGEGLELRWPAETARLSYRLSDPLRPLGLPESLTLGAEATAPLGEESEPLSVRGRLGWAPGPGEAAGDRWLRPRLELDFAADRGDAGAGWEPELGLRAQLEIGGEELLPGGYLGLALEYTADDLLRRLDGDECPADRLAAALRLSF